MITGILIAAAIVGGTGLLLGLFLGAADKKFKVEVDEKELQIRDELPGNNCGGCGYAGCDALAKAIASGEAQVSACPVGGSEVAAKLGAIMGQEAGESKHMVAFVKCAGTCDKVNTDYEYTGAEDCAMLEFVPSGGPKSCNHGCLGFGTCVKVCQFDAINVRDGVAVIDKDSCKACGKCITHCPKKLIELVPYEAKYLVQCSSRDKGKVTMQSCKAGCIGCNKCQKECPQNAITITDNVAHIDYEKCTSCGICAQKCPKKIVIGGPAA